MTREEQWAAVAGNDGACDGKFYYAVKSTGIYCRPSCRSKRPKRENTEFFATRTEAERAGYRPCKRCRPDLAAFSPGRELAERMKRVIDREFADKSRVFRELKGLGVTPGRAARIFRDRFGLTPEGYADLLRAREARRGLSEDGLPVLEVADSLGFESVPAFYAFVRKHTGETPGELRRGGGFPRAAKGSCWVYDTTIGKITIAADGVAVTALAFGERKELAELRRTELTDRAASQLAEYLAGKRRDFTVPLAPEGTAFQRSVWNALLTIPYGETRSYGQIAALIGSPKASRAVGMANNRNPIAILIPCHRVIGADGALVGYGGGLDLKRRLLALERGHRNG